MDETQKQQYLEQYKKQKEKGHPFFPDIIFKDVVVTLLVFLILVALAYFVGAPLEARADPADTSYDPKPEWYFLFLFKLLKYFPPQLEVVGVVLIPTIAVILLFLLPLLDRSRFRHFLNRPLVSSVTLLGIAGVVTLTVLAVREAPPPAEAAQGDQTAALYAKNCVGCHGPSIDVPPGTNLHELIAQGKHEGMPAWSADLSTDQIDALAGFILSPGGSTLFTENCGACHEVSELVATSPLDLKSALGQGGDYPAHAGVEVPDWNSKLSKEEQAQLLNFLVAPDGQRLFTINCSPCHGTSVAFSGDEEQLQRIISQGGMHLQMPPWREKLSSTELDTLAQYVVDPGATPDGAQLFQKNCRECHGERIPKSDSLDNARQAIASGGAHETMPIWGNILTSEQLGALVEYTLQAARGTPTEIGQELFTRNCSPCHGEFGEGGPNPARPDDVIAPISSAEFLKTRDDSTLRAIIAQGQPNFGMSPFGSAFGGPLEDEQIDAIVAYLRSWEDNPPVELPPEVREISKPLSSQEVYNDVCAQCHGENGEGGVGLALAAPEFQASKSDQELFNSIEQGHRATAMIAWGEFLSSDQISGLVELIRQFPPPAQEPAPTAAATATPATTAPSAATATPAGPPPAPSFAKDVQPILEEKCAGCHGSLGGWDASSYDTVINSGDNGPVVIPGDVEGSLLAQKIQNKQEQGTMMPPMKQLPEEEIQIILNWIEAGALQ